jgi:microcin C transport system substrate-binding protein
VFRRGHLSRRDFVQGAALAVIVRNTPVSGAPLEVGPPPAAATWTHGASLLGNLKYPAGFRHFDYVNADAPKGGSVRRAAVGTFDSFNIVIAGIKGNLGQGVELIYDTLMAPSLDEVASEYGLIAEAVSYPSDFAWVSFRLHPAAKWHDGRTISPDDVIYSLEVFKRLHPLLATYYRHVARAEQIGESEVKFAFDSPGIRELPYILGQLTVLPKHWWEGTDGSGKRRAVSETILEPPLGSGAYRIKSFEADRSIVYEVLPDYWAKDLPINVGANNFRELRFDYFRDPTIAFEAFKAGDLDWHTENVAKNWATGYDFPAVLERRVVREEFPIGNVGTMQGFAFNTRRKKFRGPRVRRAFNFAFDFEKINKDFFYGEYTRISSYFDGTELASSGLPRGRELEFLEAIRSEVSPEIFTTRYWNPISGSEAAERANLLDAMRLLFQAGFEVDNLVLLDPETGEQMKVEFLIGDQSFERIVLFYQTCLQRLGINVTVRYVDDVQYFNRLREWDFDIVVANWLETLTPGSEQRDYWGSAAANTPGSRNLVGIKNPAVDALIERIVFAEGRDDLVAATRALDRILLWNHYVVPQWNFNTLRTARWDRFGHPAPMPKYGLSAFPTLWWWNEERGAK